VHNYESTYKVFPPAGRGYGWCNATAANPRDLVVLNMSGWFLVLPFLEQTAITSGWTKDGAVSLAKGTCGSCSPVAPSAYAGDPTTNNNGLLATKRMDVFICPSEAGHPYLEDNSVFYSIKNGAPLQGAKTNYDFCVHGQNGNSLLCNHWKTHQADQRRMFGENSTTNIGMIVDGTSNTVMLAESTYDVINGRANPWAYRGWVQVGVDPVGSQSSKGINDWKYTGPAYKFGQVGSWARMGSFHFGGANAAFADGSVRFLSESLDLTTLEKLAAMADGTLNPGYNP